MIFGLLLFLCAQAAPVISIQSAIEKSLLHSPEFIAARNEMESAKLVQQNAIAAFFPSVDLAASLGESESDRSVDNSVWSNVTTLTLTEKFYDNGENYKKKNQAELRLKLAQIQLERTRARILRQVVLAYYRHNISWQNLNFTRKNFDELERLAKIVSHQFYQGLKTKKDFLRFKTRAQRSRLDVIRSEGALIEAKANLLKLMGLNPNAEVLFDLKVKPLLPQKTLQVNFEEAELYEFKILRLQEQISQIDVSLAKRRYWPELSLVGSMSYGNSAVSTLVQNERSLFLNLNFNLIDWGVRSRNIRIAMLEQVTQQESVRLTLLEVQKELEVFKFEIQNFQETYKLSKELQKMEEETFQILERDYKAGHTTYLELSTGLANLLDAQSLGLEADYNQADLYLRWKYYKGLLNEETALQ